jgi:hypothetical protein
MEDMIVPDHATSVEDTGECHQAPSGDKSHFTPVSVEAIGSPKLSRLCTVLKAECSEEIQSFWLDGTSQLAPGQVGSHCLSKIEIEQLSQLSGRNGVPQMVGRIYEIP